MAQRARMFGWEELAALAAAEPLARDLVGHHFALPNDWFERTSHQLCTRRQLRQGEVLGIGRLAQIRRLYRVLGDGEAGVLSCRRLCPHYRLCLQDHNLLARLEQEPDLPLPEFLTAVLTHELVHLVRFSRNQHPYAGPEHLRAEEEERVEAITQRILATQGHARLRRVASQLGPTSPGSPRGSVGTLRRTP